MSSSKLTTFLPVLFAASTLLLAPACDRAGNEAPTEGGAQTAPPPDTAAPPAFARRGPLALPQGDTPRARSPGASVPAPDPSPLPAPAAGPNPAAGPTPAAPPIPVPSLEGRFYAVIAGVNRYQRLSPLRRAVKDAREVDDLLRRQGYETLLISDDSDQKPLTSDHLRRALAHVAAQTEPGDTILFYFSGHGFSYPTGAESVDCICPALADPNDLRTAFSLAEARDILTGPACRARFKALIVDACRSTAFGLARPFSPPASNPEGFALLYSTSPGSVSQELAADRPGASVPDQDGDAIDNGTFTHFFKKGLGGAADADADGVIAFRELGEYVSRSMLDLSWHIPEAYQVPYWDRGILRSDIPVAACARAQRPALRPEDPAQIVALALREPAESITRFLLDKLLASGRYHSDAEYQAAANRAIGAALRQRFDRGLKTPADQLQFAALLEAVYRVDGATQPCLSQLAVGAEPEQLGERLAGLAFLLARTPPAKRVEVDPLVARLVVPYCRRAIDVQNLEVLQFAFLSGRLPVDASSVAGINAGLRRMIEMGRRDWAARLYDAFAGRAPGLCPPLALASGRIAGALDRGDFQAAAQLLECLGREHAPEALLPEVTAWLDSLLARRDAAPETVQAAVKGLDAIRRVLPPFSEALKSRVQAYVAARLDAIRSPAEVLQVSGWRQVAAAAGVPTADWQGLLAARAPRLRELFLAGLPAPGALATAPFDVSAVIDELVALDPEARGVLRAEIVRRFRAEIERDAARHDRYLPELRLAVRLGHPIEEAVRDATLRVSTLAGSPGGSLRAAETLVALRGALGAAPAIDAAAERVATGAVEEGALDALSTLARSAEILPVAARAAGRALAQRLADRAAGQAGRRALLEDLTFAARARTALAGASDALTGALAQVLPALRAELSRPIDDPAAAERLLSAASTLVPLPRDDERPLRAAILAATADSDPALSTRVEAMLALADGRTLPAPAAAKVFRHFHQRSDWDRAAEWIEAGGGAIDAKLAAQVQRVQSFRNRVKSWVGRRIPASKRWRRVEGRASSKSRLNERFEIRIDSVVGYELSGVEVVDSSREGCDVSGRIGDGWIELAASPRNLTNGELIPGLRFTEEGTYNGMPLFVARLVDGEVRSAETDVALSILDPTSSTVLLDSQPLVVPRPKYRVADGFTWPTAEGGKRELLFPIFLRSDSQVAWQVGPLLEAAGGRLEGTVLIEGVEGVRVVPWQKTQANPKSRFHLIVSVVGPGGARPVRVDVDAQGRATPFTVDCPRGTTEVRIDPGGRGPAPFAVCDGLRIVRGR
jgi:hypothetical protein